MPSEEDWRVAAHVMYRRGAATVERCKSNPQPDVQFYVEDLREALLDLKQATIAGDALRAAKFIEEVMLLAAELDEQG
jgi:hypothetical protein